LVLLLLLLLLLLLCNHIRIGTIGTFQTTKHSRGSKDVTIQAQHFTPNTVCHLTTTSYQQTLDQRTTVSRPLLSLLLPLSLCVCVCVCVTVTVTATVVTALNASNEANARSEDQSAREKCRDTVGWVRSRLEVAWNPNQPPTYHLTTNANNDGGKSVVAVVVQWYSGTWREDGTLERRGE
jgi:hypothetical protein